MHASDSCRMVLRVAGSPTAVPLRVHVAYFGFLVYPAAD